MNWYQSQLGYEAFGHRHLPGHAGTQGDHFSQSHAAQMASEAHKALIDANLEYLRRLLET